MAQFYSDQINTLRGNPALGGLQGSPGFPRNQDVKGGVMIWRFSYTIPASSGPQINDVIDLAYLFPQCKMNGIFILNSDWGVGATFSIGRVDNNNSANNSANRYLNAADMHGVVRTTVTNVMLLAGDQVGADNLGDESTGNVPLNFGADTIIIRGTFLGAAPAAAATFSGWIEYIQGNEA